MAVTSPLMVKNAVKTAGFILMITVTVLNKSQHPKAKIPDQIKSASMFDRPFCFMEMASLMSYFYIG